MEIVSSLRVNRALYVLLRTTRVMYEQATKMLTL